MTGAMGVATGVQTGTGVQITWAGAGHGGGQARR
jgi:hypothetical protein